MINRLKLINLFYFNTILSGLTWNMQAQPTHCDVQPTGENATVILTTKSDMTLDGDPLPVGTYVLAVYKDEDSLKCGGFLKWMNQNDAFTIYGNDGETKGFKVGESLKFQLELADRDQIDSVEVTFETGGLFTEGNVFQSDGIYGIKTLRATRITNATFENRIFQSFKIYPNPFNNHVNLSYAFSDLFENMEIEIYSSVGSRLLKKDLHNIQSGDFILDLDKMPTGLYFLKVTMDNIYRRNFRLIKVDN
jgi:hypothetical protein